jgi:hypothetical protein
MQGKSYTVFPVSIEEKVCNSIACYSVNILWDGAAPLFVAFLRTVAVLRPHFATIRCYWLAKRHYEVTAQPSIVIVSTTSNKPMLTTLSTFPCPSK